MSIKDDNLGNFLNRSDTGEQFNPVVSGITKIYYPELRNQIVTPVSETAKAVTRFLELNQVLTDPRVDMQITPGSNPTDETSLMEVKFKINDLTKKANEVIKEKILKRMGLIDQNLNITQEDQNIFTISTSSTILKSKLTAIALTKPDKEIDGVTIGSLGR